MPRPKLERSGTRRWGSSGRGPPDGKPRDFNNWERKGPLSPSAGPPREGGREHSHDGRFSGSWSQVRRGCALGHPRGAGRQRAKGVPCAPSCCPASGEARPHGVRDVPRTRARALPAPSTFAPSLHLGTSLTPCGLASPEAGARSVVAVLSATLAGRAGRGLRTWHGCRLRCGQRPRWPPQQL
jgi:hypothetical protein